MKLSLFTEQFSPFLVKKREEKFADIEIYLLSEIGIKIIWLEENSIWISRIYEPGSSGLMALWQSK